MMHATPIQPAPPAPASLRSGSTTLASPRIRQALDPNSREDELFSPTSAAALALSTLHHFGASRDNRRPSTLKATRLFNNISNTATNTATTTTTTTTTTTNASAIQTSSQEKDAAVTLASSQAENMCAPEATPSNAGQPVTGTATLSMTPSSSYTAYSSSSSPSASSYAPQIHHHHHHHHGTPAVGQATVHYQSYHHDPRYGVWPQQQAPQAALAGESSQAAPTRRTSSPWAAPSPYTYATSHHLGANYLLDNRRSSLGATPTPGQDPAYYHPPRSSPVAFMRPSPTLPRTSAYSNSPGHVEHVPTRISSENHLPRLASATTLVTPTPKKAKLMHRINSVSSTGSGGSTYSRKKKSLGVLAENFLKCYQDLAKGETIVVDEAAVKLGVERRRIYDVVNILESICLVCKKHKNTYSWMGMDHLDAVFGNLQAQAVEDYAEDAKTLLGITECKKIESEPVPVKPPRKHSKSRENKSLAKLSQEFLQVFLVGHETLSLPEASDKIQGTTSMEELIAIGGHTSASDEVQKEVGTKEARAAAARGLKTKIRRLYDIANVFLSVGLLKKVESTDSSRRPNFSWSWRTTAKEIYEKHQASLSGTPVLKENSVSQEESDATVIESSQESIKTLQPIAPIGAPANLVSPPKLEGQP